MKLRKTTVSLLHGAFKGGALQTTPAAPPSRCCQSRQLMNQPMPFSPGDSIKKPDLAAPFLPEQDVPKMPIYGLGKDWVVVYSRDGRPYYHHPESNTTQWAHPVTGAVTPPSRPPEAARRPSPAILGAARLVGGTLAGTALFAALGGMPLLGHVLGEGAGSHRVVQPRAVA
mmetsp:Transcript_35636/g.111161  ORF Transcript_35636/g.111161 Transcript_35636/m.111161 type:complete len:171 (-) Transcript_35636:90-602(-)